METSKEKYLIGTNDYELSLSKILGKSIKDIAGYVDHNFDEPVFKITELHFDDGTILNVNGEHDIAYLPFGDDEKYDELISELGDD